MGEFEDLSKVEKYEISEDDYAKKTGNSITQDCEMEQFSEAPWP